MSEDRGMNHKRRIDSIIEKIILFGIGMLILMFVSREKGYFLQNDSIHYLSMVNQSAVMPIYPLFLNIVKFFFGEEHFLYAVVVLQTIFAVFAAIDLVWYIKEHFHLERFSVCVCYAALLLMFEIDYVYAGMSHQILTEGLAYPLFYIYFKYILKSIWESTTKNTVVHIVLACLSALIRSQLKMLLVISAVVYFYVCIKSGFLTKRRVNYCIRGIGGLLCIMALGLVLITISDKTLRWMMYYQPVKMSTTNGDNSITSIASNEGQAAGALEFKILYLVDEDDRGLFGNEDVRTIYDIGYQALDQEKRRYVYAEEGYSKWRSLLACSGTSQTMDQAYQEYASAHPEWTQNLSVTYGEAKQIIVRELLKKHWVRYIENSSVFFVHGLMCSVCFENDQHYNWCYAVMVIAYLSAIAVSILVGRSKKMNKETLELMIVTVTISFLMIGMVSVILFTIRRYVSYTIGLFYMSGYLMVREIILQRGKR